MPTIGHVAVGLAAGRMFARDPTRPAPAMIGGSLLALAPDLDILGPLTGAPPGSPLDHRGALHSVLTALLIGLATVGAARLLRGSPHRGWPPSLGSASSAQASWLVMGSWIS